MADRSIQRESSDAPDPSGQLSNEEYAAIVDAFAAAIYEATSELRPPTADRLARATSDLLEALASRSTRLVTRALEPAIERLERLQKGQAELERRFDRRQANNADITTTLRDIQSEVRDHGQRLAALEQRQVGGDDGPAE